MSDSRSPIFFARLFEWLAEQPDDRAKQFAREMQGLSMEYDFASCELECDDAMVALGIAKVAKPEPGRYDEDDERVIYLFEDYQPEPIPVPEMVQKLADGVGGTITEAGALPDGSGFAVMSMPLPKDHWIYGDGSFNVPPMGLRMGTDDPRRQEMNEKVTAAARYAVKCATMDGKEMDFDPDALCQNMVVGLLGYHTPDGFCSDEWANPKSE